MKILVSVAIAGAAVALLVLWSGVGGADLAAAFRAIEPAGFAAFLALQALVYVLRGLRLRALVQGVGHIDCPRFDGPSAVAAATAWTFDGQVLPARIGEASLVLHVGRLGVPKSVGVMALLVSRILDLVVLALVFGTAALVAGGASALPRPAVLLALGGGSLALALGLGIAVRQGGALFGALGKAARGAGLTRYTAGARAAEVLDRVEVAFRSLDAADFRRAFLWTLPLTASIFAAYVALGGASGLPELSPLAWIFATACAMVGGLVPVSGFLGVGAFDLAFAAGFAFVGVPKDDATASGLVFHAMYLVGVTVYGLFAHAVLARR